MCERPQISSVLTVAGAALMARLFRTKTEI